jgi:hypothetical protein
MPASACAKGWFDDQDASTIDVEAGSPGGEEISEWRNKITDATDHAIPRDFNNPDPWTSGPTYNSGQMMFTALNSSVLDIQLPAQHTGANLWCIIVGRIGPFSGGPDNVFVEFGNDGELAQSNADSLTIMRNGTNYQIAVDRSGETDALSDTVPNATDDDRPGKSEFMLLVRCDGTNKIVRTNGVLSDTETSTTAFDITRVRLGARGDDNSSYDLKGTLRAIVYGTCALTDEDVEKLEGFMAHWRGKPTEFLPTTHTHYSSAPMTS